MPKHPWRRALDIAFVSVFVGGLAAVFIATDWRGDASWVVQFELRPAAEMPGTPTNFAALAAFPARFGAFFDDHFGFRRQMVASHGTIALNVLRKSTSPLFLVGKDGWLFFTGDGSIDNYRGLTPLSPQAIADWKQRLEVRRLWFAARGIAYLFVVAPDKQSIYPEYMPDTIPHAHGPTRLDQLVAATVGDGALLDLRPFLRERKPDGALYMAKDTHWNDWGGYFSYRAIMVRLGLPVLPVRNSDFGLSPHDNADLSRLIGTPAPELTIKFTRPGPSCAKEQAAEIDTSLLDTPAKTLSPLWSTVCATGAGRLLIFHDSFGGGLWTFLSQSFARTVFVLHQPTLDQMQRITEIEHPTVVIEERVERRLGYPLRP